MANSVQDKTADIIETMLKENTGTHFLDSGGAYGRHWEKNQGRDFRNEDACLVHIGEYDDDWYLELSYNIFHFLNNFLEYTKECEAFERQFKTFCETPQYKDAGWLHCMEDWADKVHEPNQYVKPETENTYNYGNLLSQVIQFTLFEKKEKTYILLQIHGGCDVRGGYTEPRIFRVPDMESFSAAMHDIDAHCDKCDTYWYSDNAGGNFHECIDAQHQWKEVDYNKELKTLQCPCGGKIEFSVTEDW